MRRMLRFIVLLGIMMCSFEIKGQVDSLFQVEENSEEILQRYEELIGEEDENQEELQELMLEEIEARLSTRKINLNEMTPEQAFEMLHLSDYQYYQLLAYVCNYGELVAVNELMAIEGYTNEDFNRLLPYVDVWPVRNKSVFFKNFFKKMKNSLLLRYGRILEPKLGYDTTREQHYLGSPFRMAFKYQFSNQDKLLIAFSGEKDAGEQFFRGAQKRGFDFYSGHICLKNVGLLKKLIIGDYRANLGQGLVVGSALMSGKGGDVGSVRRFASSVRPVAPLNESGFYRGLAAEIGNYRFSGTVYAGHRSNDGKLVGEDEKTAAFEGSLNSSGYHRSETEIMKKDKMHAWMCGMDFLYRGRVFRVGVRMVHTQFSREVLPSDKVYQLYSFAGKGMSNLGVDYQWVIKKVLLFGETAVSGNGGVALLQGVRCDLSPGFSLAALFRYGSKKYIALQGSSSGNSKNEIGFYLTSQIVLNEKTDCSFFYDYVHYPWLRYRVDAPNRVIHVGVGINYTVNRQSHIEFKYQYKMKDKNNHGEACVNEIIPFHSSRIRGAWVWNLFEFLKLKTELSYVINHSREINYLHDGILLYQDAGVTFRRVGITVNGRLAFCDVDTYEERLYAYENDIYYNFTINSHYDKAWTCYLMFQYKYKCISMWLRVSQVWYLNKTTISSGLEQIDSSHKTELKLQVMLKI